MPKSDVGGRGRLRRSALNVAAAVGTELYKYLLSDSGTINQRYMQVELMAAAPSWL